MKFPLLRLEIDDWNECPDTFLIDEPIEVVTNRSFFRLIDGKRFCDSDGKLYRAHSVEPKGYRFRNLFSILGGSFRGRIDFEDLDMDIDIAILKEYAKSGVSLFEYIAPSEKKENMEKIDASTSHQEVIKSIFD